ncbi:Uma2 family endonuclease [Synechococcales cyanobacterium C]|uniref:Uma2 family endonuclease n=1 Tax=Petrachloros mirabilis ULC683 TaxID=2781853 RepID=A0A8K2A1Q9_9CYAN|nr:Uma2 family endonuclease [Petrachloros mirabilis]NCJ08206.1 Uma2 family endonuclease [Petrachloros mirabilis ULC683]
MTEIITQLGLPSQFPDHTQLPESDGTFVKNFEEHPQSLLLTDSIEPLLQRLHPDGQYCIGQDCGIYWRETEPPERGAEAPDWFYVADVPPKLGGVVRRSYVLWREYIAPTIALEFASGDGSEERDRTSLSWSNGTIKPGKFWVYEHIIHIPFYGIYEINSGRLEVYHLIEGSYQALPPNERGHYVIAPMQVELGVWQGGYLNYPEQRWLRWWDAEGNLLLTGAEQTEVERQRAEQAEQRAEQAEEQLQQERQQRQQLVEKLRSLSPEQIQALGISLSDL